MRNIDFKEFTNTYSIVAFDPIRKQLGVAMQTHNFAACNGVIWAEPGVGVVASQSFTNPIYGYDGLKRMKQGTLPKQILKELIKEDEDSEYRQVAILDRMGNIVTHTGTNCIGEAGHRIGKNYSCQANMMIKNTVWDAMGHAFENCTGDLAQCIISALEAAQNEGGDMRGAQSAAIRIVTSETPKSPWGGILYDFKVYDNPKPLEELKRLVNLKKAYNSINDCHDRINEIKSDPSKVLKAIEEFNSYLEKIPNEDGRVQQQFYYGLTLLKNGLRTEAIILFKNTFETNPIWREIAIRSAKAECNDELLNIVMSEL